MALEPAWLGKQLQTGCHFPPIHWPYPHDLLASKLLVRQLAKFTCFSQSKFPGANRNRGDFESSGAVPAIVLQCIAPNTNRIMALTQSLNSNHIKQEKKIS